MSDDALPAPARRIYCNRTLNLRAIRAVGFDMDYTLVHYRVDEWERRAYEHARSHLLERGFPVGHLKFDSEFAILGLCLDLELGNIVKASRFGYVTNAFHGTERLAFERQRELYSRVVVDLHEPRWVFLNTLFSLSEATLFAQCVDLLDAGKLEPGVGPGELYRIVRGAVDATHMEGALKAEIAKNPEPFVELDPDLPLALLDLKTSGKKLLLITNSEWSFTRAMMGYAVEPYLPRGTSWRDLFEVVIVSARKPDFFKGRSPMFEIVDDEGLLRPVNGTMKSGSAYLGGNARIVEHDLGLSAEDILYVGDHLYADVHVTKDMLRWRTALVLRDLERELAALGSFTDKQAELSELMAKKEALEHGYSQARVQLMRIEAGYGSAAAPPEELRAQMQRIRGELSSLDDRIAPLAQDAGCLQNRNWGLLMRAGIDKSYLARQVERYADVYTSRVSNLLELTPFVYLRAPRVSLPHDAGLDAST